MENPVPLSEGEYRALANRYSAGERMSEEALRDMRHHETRQSVFRVYGKMNQAVSDDTRVAPFTRGQAAAIKIAVAGALAEAHVLSYAAMRDARMLLDEIIKLRADVKELKAAAKPRSRIQARSRAA